MTSPMLHADVVREDDRVAVIRVAGEVDLATAPLLAAALEGIGSGKAVHVDMIDVTFLDSAEISVLVEWRDRIEGAGGSLVLHRAGPQIERVLEISGLGRLFELRPDPPA